MVISRLSTNLIQHGYSSVWLGVDRHMDGHAKWAFCVLTDRHLQRSVYT